MSDRMVFEGSGEVTQRIGLIHRPGVHRTRRVQGNLSTMEDELDELFIQLGESRSGLVQQLKVNSTSCLYNTASRMKDHSRFVKKENSSRHC